MTAKKTLSLLAAACLLVSCGPDKVKNEKPSEWVLPKEKMVAVLSDVHLIEGAKIGSKTIGDTLSIATYYQKVWAKHNITQQHYDSSFAYYSRNAPKMDKLYAKVLEKLSKLEAEVQAKNPDKQGEDI